MMLFVAFLDVAVLALSSTELVRKPLASRVVRAAAPRLDGGIDAANRCTRLDAEPVAVTLHLPRSGHGVGAPQPGAVHLRIGDGEVIVGAPSAEAALGGPCRKLVSEQSGGVTRIDIGGDEKGSSRALSGLRRAVAIRRLSAAYGQRAHTVGHGVEDEPPPSSPALPAPSCDVFFVRPGARQSAGSIIGTGLRAIGRLPGIASGVRVSSALLGALGRDQLTPTSEPSLTLRLLRPLPWQLKRFAARCWVQAMLEAVPPRGEGGARGARQRGSRAEVGSHSLHPMQKVRAMPMPTEASICTRHAYIHAYAHIHALMHVHTHMHAHMDAHICAHMHAHRCVRCPC